MKEKLTALFQKTPEGYVGCVEELPGANSRGGRLGETRENLTEAVQLVLNTNRRLFEEEKNVEKIIDYWLRHDIVSYVFDSFSPCAYNSHGLLTPHVIDSHFTEMYNDRRYG